MKNELIELGKVQNIDIEISEESCMQTDINLMNDKVSLFQTTDVTEYIIKAIKDDRCVKIAVDSLKKPEEIIENILNIFAISDNDNKNTICKNSISKKQDTREDLDFNEVSKDLLTLNNLKEKYPEISNIEITYNNSKIVNKINNNYATLEDEEYFNVFGAGITVTACKVTRVCYLNWYSSFYDIEGFREYLDEKISNLIIKIDSQTCKTNKYNVILTNNVVADILSTFASSFQSKGICLNESVLSNKYKKKIFSEKINIIDDASKGINSRAFDSEGVKTSKTNVVDGGVFKNKLNNLEYALKLNEEETGNADGANYLYIAPGDKTFSELVCDLNDGIIIDEAYGFHSGVDKKSGVISVQAEGLLVKNGKIIKGINGVVLSTNIFEVFSNVVEIGNDLSQTSLEVAAPSLLLQNITIAGGK